MALNGDGTWGIKGDDGIINYKKTIELLENVAAQYSEADTDAILTLGRIDREVEVTKRTLLDIHSSVQIKSFSSNSETTNAYVYLDDPTHLNTGQKILIGNTTEMILNTAMDIFDGSDVVVIKPIENLHILSSTVAFLDSQHVAVDFLTSSRVRRISDRNVRVKQKISNMLMNIDEFHQQCRRVRVGAYTVSGTYYMQKLLEEKKGAHFAFGIVDELLKNGVSACDQFLDHIVDRNALWYVKQTNN